MAENDFQRASMRGLGKKILLGDESTELVESVEPVQAINEPASAPVSPVDDPAILKLTADEESELLATVSASMTPVPTHVSSSQESLPPLELDMPRATDLAGEMRPLTDDLQSLVADAYETADQLSSIDREAIPALEDELVSFVSLDSADTILPHEIATLVNENFETWDASTHPAEPALPSADQSAYSPKPEPHQPPVSSIPVAAGRNELNHMLPLIAGWVVAILVLIYQLIKDTKRDEKENEG